MHVLAEEYNYSQTGLWVTTGCVSRPQHLLLVTPWQQGDGGGSGCWDTMAQVLSEAKLA